MLTRSTTSRWAMILNALSLLLVPSYFKFVLDSNSLTGATFLLYIGYIFRRRFAVASNKKLSIQFKPREFPYNIRVLSYNIFLRPPFVKNNADDFKNERFSEFLNHMDQFEIICLQEMFNLANSRQRRLLSIAKEKGFMYYAKSVNPSWLSGKFIDAGLVILSKYPILDTDGLIYQAGNQIDSWAAKQVIYAKVQVSPTCLMHLFTTHLQASYFDNVDSINVINDKARSTQVQEMADFIKLKTQGSPYPVLITGDFNINSRMPGGGTAEQTPEYQYMMHTLTSARPGVRDLVREEYGFHPITYGDVEEADHPIDLSLKVPVPKEVLLTHTADHCCSLCIDYIFFSDTEANHCQKVLEVASTRVEEFFVDSTKHTISQLSDHYGVVTELRVNKYDFVV